MKEGVSMRYIITLLWSFALGQVVGYLGSALSSQPYNFIQTSIFSVICGLMIITLGRLTPTTEEKIS